MPDLPSGTVTFLFTDIEGSTRLVHELRERYGDVLAAHARILRGAFEEHSGREIDTQGDSFFVAFRTAKDALAAAVAAQQGLAAEPWLDGARPAVRMGIHTGEPSVAGERYLGLAVHRASRICSAGHGGQILLSGTTGDLVADELPSGTSLRPLGEHKLKDFERPERVYQVVVEGLPADFPPLATDRASMELEGFRGREGELAEAAEAAVAETSWPTRRLRARIRLISALGFVVAAAAAAVILAARGGSGDTDVSGTVAARSLAVIDPVRNAVAGSLSAGGSPASLAGDGKTLWVANAADKTLLRVDSGTRTLVGTIGLGATPNDVVAAGGAVWVTGDGFGNAPLLEVTPATNAVTYAADPECCVGFAFAAAEEGRVWLTATDGPSIVRYDPGRGRIGTVVCCSVAADAIALGEGALWGVERDDQLVLRMDPESGSIEAKIPFGAPRPQGRIFLRPEVVSAAATGEGGVWVVDSLEGVVWQIDPVQDSVKRTISVGVGAKSVTTGFGSVWVANTVTGTVTRIDPKSGRIVKRIKVATRLGEIAVAGNGVWVGVP
jgi:class 3 adenylate cyclase